VGFVVDEVAMGQVSVRILWFSAVSFIQLMLHIHSCIIRNADSGPVSRTLPQIQYDSNRNNSIQFSSFIHVLDNSQTRPITAKPKNNIRYIEMKDKETVFKENKTTETRANVGYEAYT
jgi:hypothetical protein